MVRTFLAIPLPTSVKEVLAHLIEELKDLAADVRWVRPESIHLTLWFFGSLEERRLGYLIEALEREDLGDVFSLQAEGLGFFPPGGRPRVIWAGVSGDLDRLKALKEGLDRLVAPLGFRPEKRPFSPHLTLGRLKSNRGLASLLKRLASFKGLKTPSFEVREIVLYRSDLRPNGAYYTPIRRFPLKERGQN
ncbi:RNA 2',3'-cyclic phosphodiesterase [Thermosulfuriphilus sp.]